MKPDYFIEGVKLMVSFDDFGEEDGDVEMNVTVPGINVADALGQVKVPAAAGGSCIARYEMKGEKKEKRLEFAAGHSVTVGRIGANTLVLDDPSVSKSHASLAAGNDGCLSVADTGSTNGTFINDERIAYGKAVRLEKDDRVKFGTVEVTFEYLPGPVVTGPAEAAADESEDTVSIDGFEFKRRTSPEPPREGEVAEDTLPAIPFPTAPISEDTSAADPIGNETLKMEPGDETAEDESGTPPDEREDP